MALESLKDQMDNTNPPRVKAEKFDKFMQEREVGGFHKEEYDDQFRTVVYFSSMQIAAFSCQYREWISLSRYNTR